MADETTTGYIDLATQGYGLFVDALSAVNQSALGYTKSLYDIVSKPYTSTAVETTVRENFDRAEQLVSLTVGKLQNDGKLRADFAEKTATYLSKVQESSLVGLRGLWKTGVSNITYARETADQQFEGITKRVDELQSRVVAGMGRN